MSQGLAKRISLEDGIYAEVVRERYNPLIKRRELELLISHELKPTPMRITLRMQVSEALGVDVKLVYVRSIRTEYGIGRSWARIHVYESVDRALEFEPKHIVERNGGVSPFEEV
ncbi:MAG: 30S ribosomal protein S24e [Desulfurococcales archaeon]|nr:30S ribosomal protein S24e [Desulfurococcales archaeon]